MGTDCSHLAGLGPVTQTGSLPWASISPSHHTQTHLCGGRRVRTDEGHWAEATRLPESMVHTNVLGVPPTPRRPRGRGSRGRWEKTEVKVQEQHALPRQVVNRPPPLEVSGKWLRAAPGRQSGGGSLGPGSAPWAETHSGEQSHKDSLPFPESCALRGRPLPPAESHVPGEDREGQGGETELLATWWEGSGSPSPESLPGQGLLPS